MEDADFMYRCLTLAEKGRGKAGANPLVGAVLVRDGRIIAEAFCKGFGLLHAERHLLQDFRGEVLPSDILYVNLEPCCHFGKTPPCTDIIIERGVRHVVFGMVDPDSQVRGKGIACLLKAGIRVTGPVERARCEWLNRGFVTLRTKGRPWVTIHRAQTKDREIAKSDGSPLKITSPEQDRWVHEWLRARHDAILLGVQTIITDNPQLNTRFIQGLSSPLRLILDPHLRLPLEARVVNGALAGGTVVITAPGAAQEKRRQLEGRGVRIMEVPLKDDRFDFSSLWKVLITPSSDYNGIASILIEGGDRTWEIFREERVVDAEVVLVDS